MRICRRLLIVFKRLHDKYHFIVLLNALLLDPTVLGRWSFLAQ